MRLALLTTAACIVLVPAALYAADVSEAIARVDPAVVTVRAGNAGGAGFAINADGQIVTCAHVVGKIETVSVKFLDGTVKDAQVEATDKGRDLAVLKVQGDMDSWAEFGSTQSVKLGEDVVAIGAPLGLEHSVTKGVVSSRSRVIGTNPYVQIDAALNPGNSGGPVIDSRGAVIGVSTVVARRAENVGFAIASEIVVAFLEEHGVQYHVTSGDVIAPVAQAEPEAGAPQPFSENPSPSLPLMIAIAFAVSVITSTAVSILVLRLGINRLAQRMAAHAPRPPAAPGEQPREDFSDIDITLQ